MARWSNDEIEWVVASGELTDDFDDNHIEAYGVRNGWLSIFVDYTKGTEDYIELQLYFDNSNREQLEEENWFALSADGFWPAEGNMAAGVATYVGVRAMPWRFTATGKYRILMPSLPREDAIRLAVKADDNGDDGAVKIRFALDDISWGGVGQGSE